MKNYLILFILLVSANLLAQEKLLIKIEVSEEMKPHLKSNGRLFVFLNENPDVEPRTQNWPSAGNEIFAKNIVDFDKSIPYQVNSANAWSSTSTWNLNEVPQGTYYVQVLWSQSAEEPILTAAGNVYSEKQKVVLDSSKSLTLVLDKLIEPSEIAKHELVREVVLKSEKLSNFWNKPMYVKASLLLPKNYQKDKGYPIRYNISGYGGRYNRVNRLVQSQDFMDWWLSDDAPEIINVFVDAAGPFGDNYHLDSENSGPYGSALIEELAPSIEKEYRNATDARTRFVDGCSTGGWVSLGLQLYYPDFFNGVFSYSPDAIDFENYQLINIYKDKNAYINEHGYVRPVMRDTNGEPMMSLKDFIRYENVMGANNTYLTSGGQFSAHTALYSPKGPDGLPTPLFDPISGEIDSIVAKHWEKYDFKKHVAENWETLGPKIQGKIYVWMGDMDNFYLNTGTRGFESFMKTTQKPTSDAVFEYTPMKGHCANFSNKTVLLQIKDRLKELGK